MTTYTRLLDDYYPFLRIPAAPVPHRTPAVVLAEVIRENPMPGDPGRMHDRWFVNPAFWDRNAIDNVIRSGLLARTKEAIFAYIYQMIQLARPRVGVVTANPEAAKGRMRRLSKSGSLLPTAELDAYLLHPYFNHPRGPPPGGAGAGGPGPAAAGAGGYAGGRRRKTKARRRRVRRTMRSRR